MGLNKSWNHYLRYETSSHLLAQDSVEIAIGLIPRQERLFLLAPTYRTRGRTRARVCCCVKGFSHILSGVGPAVSWKDVARTTTAAVPLVLPSDRHPSPPATFCSYAASCVTVLVCSGGSAPPSHGNFSHFFVAVLRYDKKKSPMREGGWCRQQAQRHHRGHGPERPLPPTLRRQVDGEFFVFCSPMCTSKSHGFLLPVSSSSVYVVLSRMWNGLIPSTYYYLVLWQAKGVFISPGWEHPSSRMV